MSRKPLGKKPMEPAERRRKSDAEKIKRGERRVTAWISESAARALDQIIKAEGCETKVALETALEHYVK